MAGHSRREFLKRTALAGGALALGPSGIAGAQAASGAPAQMAVARWKGAPAQSAEAIKTMAIKLTEEALKAVGGMGRFVKTGDVVWVKPNMAWDRTPEQAANTNPDVVATLVRLCLEAGAKKVKVGDKTCNDAPKSYPNSGIEAAAKAAGAEVVYLDDSRFKDTMLKGKRLDKWPVYPEILEANLVINVPIAKHHSLSKATLCMKNYMGVIGGNRGEWHQDLTSCLCDITAFMKPKLCVLDAVRILTANGPTGGDLKDVKRMDTVAAGVDIVAMDAFGAELLGLKSADLPLIEAAQSMGLGQGDYRKLALKELEVA